MYSGRRLEGRDALGRRLAGRDVLGRRLGSRQTLERGRQAQLRRAWEDLRRYRRQFRRRLRCRQDLRGALSGRRGVSTMGAQARCAHGKQKNRTAHRDFLILNVESVVRHSRSAALVLVIAALILSSSKSRRHPQDLRTPPHAARDRAAAMRRTRPIRRIRAIARPLPLGSGLDRGRRRRARDRPLAGSLRAGQGLARGRRALFRWDRRARLRRSLGAGHDLARARTLSGCIAAMMSQTRSAHGKHKNRTEHRDVLYKNGEIVD